MNDVNSLISSFCSCASSAPVRTFVAGGRIGSISRISCSGVVPGLPATEIASNSPFRPRSSCAVAMSKMLKVAEPSESTFPYWAIPTSLNGRLGWSVAISTVSPTAYPSLSAVPASITTSSGAVGQRPSSRFSGLNREYSGLVSMPNPRLGAPCVSTAFPSLVRIFAFDSS